MTFDSKLLSGLTVLIAVVEAGTIARAAEALGVSPSGVSRALSRLEQREGAAIASTSTMRQTPGPTTGRSDGRKR